MEAAQVDGAMRSVLARLTLFAATGMLGLAFATPARADDQSPPPPLMLGKSALIAPDEPDAIAIVDTGTSDTASSTASAAEPLPAKAIAADGWELAAKPHHLRAAAV